MYSSAKIRKRKRTLDIFQCFFSYQILCQVNEVIGVVYQYLKLMREAGPQAWIFKELQDIGNMEFRFVEEQPQDDYAAEFAGPFFYFHYMSLNCLLITISHLCIYIIQWITLKAKLCTKAISKWNMVCICYLEEKFLLCVFFLMFAGFAIYRSEGTCFSRFLSLDETIFLSFMVEIIVAFLLQRTRLGWCEHDNKRAHKSLVANIKRWFSLFLVPNMEENKNRRKEKTERKKNMPKWYAWNVLAVAAIRLLIVVTLHTEKSTINLICNRLA